MKTKVISFIFRFVLVLSFLFYTGCAAIQEPLSVVPQILPGQLYALQNGSTALGVSKAMTGELGAKILQNGYNLFFYWNSPSIPNTTAFWSINMKYVFSEDLQTLLKLTTGSEKGQIGEYQTVKSLVEYLKSNGWSEVSWTSLSAATRTTVMNFLDRGCTVFIFMFSGAPATIDQLYPTYQQ